MFRFLFSPYGRISRLDMWVLYLLPLLAASFASGYVDEFTFGRDFIKYGALRDEEISTGIFRQAVGVFYFWPNIAVTIKRFHDQGASGWWAVLFYVVLLVPCIFAIWIVLVSSPGSFAGFALEEADSKLEFIVLAAWLGTLIVGLLVLVIYLVILYVLPGDQGPNRFGEDPLAEQP